MDQNQELRKELTEARKQGHFIFVPSVPLPKINGLFVPVLEKVILTADDYYLTQGKFGQRHFALMKLADAAGIKWAAEMGRVGRTDNMSNPNYCSFRVVAQIRTSEGLWIDQAANKHMDLDAKREAIEAKHAESFDYKAKFGGGKGPNGWDVKKPWPADKKEYVEKFTARDIGQLKENIDERCESGAQARAIKNLLHLPANFPADPKNKNIPDCLSKKFYIVRYILDPQNPHVQAAQLANFQQAMNGIYGIAAPVSPTQMLPMRDVTPPTPPAEPKAIPQAQAPKIDTTDFENITPEDQEKTILALIEDSGYLHYEDDMKGQPELSLWSQENRTHYFIHIQTKARRAS